MSKFARRGGLCPAAQITAAIIEKLEQGTRPWVRPGRCVPVSRPLRSCGTPYRGMNTFWLWMIAEGAGFLSPYWMTYRQCQKLGGQVRKGEKSTIAVFYKSYDKQVERDDGEEETQSRRVLNAYSVFNADQRDDLPAMYRPKVAEKPVEPAGREERLDAFFSRVNAQLRHQGSEAHYEPIPVRITMPQPALFDGHDHYYATLADELSHWTGHASRLGRDLRDSGSNGALMSSR
jgi:antirestriction protein ArdC